MIILTTNHARSSYNIPVFVDSDTGEVIDYPDGFRILRKERGWSTTELAEKLGVKRRTVEGWEFGKNPSTTALRLLQKMLGYHITNRTSGRMW